MTPLEAVNYHIDHALYHLSAIQVGHDALYLWLLEEIKQKLDNAKADVNYLANTQESAG